MVSNSQTTSALKSAAPIFGRRHLQCFMICIGFSAAFAMRVNLSVAVVAMMDNKGANPDFPEYHWSEKTKSRILSSFFFGYVFTQVPGGILARRIGGKILLLLAFSISSVLALLTPWAVSFGGWKLLCFIRFLQGFGQGTTMPAIHTLVAKWSPVEERSSLSGYCYSGAQLGTVVILASSGVLDSSSLGWPSLFYIPGAVGLLWAVAWIIWGANSPDECRSVSAAERALITESLNKKAKQEEGRPTLPVPWRAIFTSLPFLVLLLSHCANSWVFWTILTQIPSYMKSVLGKDIKSNALLSALPYLTMFILGLAFCPMANYLEKSNRISATTSRKLFNSLGLWVPVVTLIWLGYMTREQSDLAIILLTFTVGMNSAAHLGFQVNHIDLTPNFAGTLVGMTNSASHVASSIAPLVVGYVVTDTKNPEQWRIIFFIAAFIIHLLFVFFGTAKVQPWNDEQTGKVYELKPLNRVVVEKSSGNTELSK
ncbi:putative inorganic phosphate cotransporter [Zeugodacus cucurbitae]|uniref:putative inorganic phosphate cotransporter n=1 Tax=Zeugodacus cucurbitae TaxID=28588 RepID=UPI0005969128|nr:putative inorganic phosphate cotransporter [Zeugodacus cucurbitae]